MTMRAKGLPYYALIYCVLLPLAADAVDNGSAGTDQAHALFNAFEVMCNLNTPDMQRLSDQAAAMRMKVLADASEAPGAGETIQRKAWLGMLDTGPFALRAEEMRGAKGVATSCAIEGPVPDVEAFRNMVISTLRLNSAPERHIVEGAPSYYWDNYAGNGMTIMVRNWERPSGHFVQVKLLNMVKQDP